MTIATHYPTTPDRQESLEFSRDQVSIRQRRIGILKEITRGECRVAATPETAQILIQYGFSILVETGAGSAANFSDQDYQAIGCEICDHADRIWQEADIILKVQPPHLPELEQIHPDCTLISFIWANQHPEILPALRQKRTTVLAMEAIPRVSRAQKFDALSAMANIAGYRAVIEAANHFGRFFTGQITAAGKVPPAKVLVIGAGVAGLAAIGTAKSLGAIVRAFDTRPVVKEQVESLGATFLTLNLQEDGAGQGGYSKEMSAAFIAAEMALFQAQAAEVDIIITTALIPGKPAPKLITREIVEQMKPGSVIVDLAAEQGGNCELTEPGRSHCHQGVTIIGFTDLPSRMASQASQLYGKNLCHLLDDLGRNDHYHIDLNDAVIRNSLLLYEGEPVTPIATEPTPPTTPAPEEPATVSAESSQVSPPDSVTPDRTQLLNWLSLISLITFLAIGAQMPSQFLSHFTVFVLACFVGWQVIWNVKPSLHTPLMSVTNAISGIIILGGILQLSNHFRDGITILSAIAIFIGTINIVGGFCVTQRMLQMFQK